MTQALLADRVYETTTSTGAGAVTLRGAATPRHRTFLGALGAAATTFYAIVHRAVAQWEVGVGVVNADGTLTRTTVLRNHLGTTALVTFSAGMKDVFQDIPAEKTLTLDAESSNLTLPASLTVIGTVTAAAFSGPLTGNASTAMALATARAINGVNFDGSAPITVTAEAGTLSGTALNMTVVSSSLTSVGTLIAGAVPASLVTAGTFGAGAYAFPSTLSALTLRDSTDVKYWGAKGDGTTNDTTAIQAALNASTNVYFPSGTYVVSNLTVANDGTTITANKGAVLQMAVGATGVLLSGGANRVSISGLSFDGGGSVSLKTDGTTSSRNGVSVRATVDSRIDGISVYGFAGIGVTAAAGPDYARLTHLNFTNSSIYNCHMGYKVAGGASEYTRASNLDINNNYYGLDIESGNFTGSNLKINNNGTGVWLDASVYSGNPGHGNINNSLINHNTTAIFADGLFVGFNFTGNSIFEGDIHLKDTYGVHIEAGTLDVTNYYFENAKAGFIRNNYCPNGYGNTVHHNYNSTTDSMVFVDTWKNSGAVDDNIGLYSPNTVKWYTNSPNYEQLEVSPTLMIASTNALHDGFVITAVSDILVNVYASSTATAADLIFYKWGIAGGEVFRLAASGNVGIGVPIPAAKLDVNGLIQGVSGNFTSVYGTTPLTAKTNTMGGNSYGGLKLITNDATTYWAFAAVNAFTASDLLIGYNSQDFSNYLLKVSIAGDVQLRLGSFTAAAGFGCNSKTAQTAYASGGALAAYGAGANGFDSGANASALYAMVVAIRAMAVANGLMS